ncbi:N-formylglutamate amidohydrolase [Chelativorans salis]|uniref:N-formylglutamate amidohydrolase n=1 Tax=Chelativorans salis TaxID=2978478 RepID=A0ABT2LPA5_9HYPH|nr:N-formylglutamate amidohydrolase [Chelativorans sp. EGI FJ00035]MCT7376292.1 N-formylglutamate amidohydrolase [Chelativorans sp. EGI FJ00035]
MSRTHRELGPSARETLQEMTVRRHDPAGSSTPVVFDSPHSGAVYPPDFRPAVPLHLLQGGEDRFVDELVADAPRHGAVLVIARFARTYIDPNRTLVDLDEELLEEPWPGPVSPSDHTKRGVGLIFREIGDKVPIYDRLLSIAEVQRRIDLCWRPYHEVLDAALDEAHRCWGAAWHVNCHSMTGFGNALSPDPGRARPAFVLGDRDGTSCAPEFTAFVASVLEEMDYSVAINDPYEGAELVWRHGRPTEGRHSLQIEINRDLYMDPSTLEKNDGFPALRASLGRLADRICRYARDAAPSDPAF